MTKRGRKAELMERAEDALAVASCALVSIYAVLEHHQLTHLQVQFEDEPEPIPVDRIYRRTMEIVRPVNQALDRRHHAHRP